LNWQRRTLDSTTELVEKMISPPVLMSVIPAVKTIPFEALALASDREIKM
jgi:hypothetical protein